MRMMQQLVVGENWESSSPILEGSTPHSKNENQPSPNPNQGQTTPPFTPQGYNQEVDPPKDKTLESGYGQVKGQVETLIEKICIIEGFSARGSMMALEILMPICACSVGRWHLMGTIILCSARFSLIT